MLDAITFMPPRLVRSVNDGLDRELLASFSSVLRNGLAMPIQRIRTSSTSLGVSLRA